MNLWINYGNEAYSNYYVQAETERFLYIDKVTGCLVEEIRGSSQISLKLEKYRN